MMEKKSHTYPKHYCRSCKYHDFDNNENQYCMLKNHPIAVLDTCEKYKEEINSKNNSNIKVFFMHLSHYLFDK